MTKLVFLVDDILPSGRIVTATDRLKEHHTNWQPNIYERVVDCYRKYCINDVTFMPLRELNGKEPGVQYAYFVPMNDWHWTMQQIFFMIDKETQKKLVDVNAFIYFCQDIEMYPNVRFPFLVEYLGIVKLFQAAHGHPDLKIGIGMCASLEQSQHQQVKHNFGDAIRLIHTPIMIPYSRDAIIEKYASQNLEFDPSAVFDEYLKSDKQRDFMCLSRDPKFSRIMFLHALRAYGLLDSGYVSNLMSTDIQVMFNNLDHEHVRNIDRDIRSGPIPRIEVDHIDEHHMINALAHNGTAGVLPFDHMRLSCYDIIQETTTRYEVSGVLDQGVVTEKTVKSLMFGRPFMINGGPGVLNVIRNMGFKTCEYMFDEDYDNSSEMLSRHSAIIANALRWRGKRKEIMRRVNANISDLIHNLERVQNFPVEAELIKALVPVTQ